VIALRSPISGRALALSGYSLVGVGERWPVVDGIPFLRADRRAMADAALAALDSGDPDEALVLLLGDQDAWAKTPPPDKAARLRLVRERATLSFRDAMELLAFGPVATYFAHRWSDPTFLSGLALAEAHWHAPDRVLELACGAGHFLRAFAGFAPEVTGGDLVFAKLWLARHYVAPGAALVCFDAAAPWPFADDAADLVFCHDAFYFLPDKLHVAAKMLRVAGGGRVLVGHAHNAAVDNLSAGAPLEPTEYAALFGTPLLYDDRELTQAAIEARAPRPASAGTLRDAPAVALAAGAASRDTPNVAVGGLVVPRAGAALRRNPLYAETGEIAWPSDRYAHEYGSLATYPARTDAPAMARAGSDATIDALARRRVLLDLPERW